MSDPSLYIRWGDFQAGAVGHVAIVALVVAIVLVLGAKWRGIL